MPASTERYVVFTYRLDRELDARVKALGADQGITNKTQALNFFVREGVRAVELRDRAASEAAGIPMAPRPGREPVRTRR